MNNNRWTRIRQLVLQITVLGLTLSVAVSVIEPEFNISVFIITVIQ